MFTSDELADLAAMSEAAMTDTCVITTRTESSTGGEPTVTTATLYSGRCRVYAPGGPRVVVVGEKAQPQTDNALMLPRSAAAVPPGAQVVVTSAADGTVTTYRTGDTLPRTTQASRRVALTKVG